MTMEHYQCQAILLKQLFKLITSMTTILSFAQHLSTVQMLNSSKLKCHIVLCIEFTIQENATVNSTVGIVKATDSDTSLAVKYSVTDPHFKFDNSPDGRLLYVGTMEEIDFETTPQ